MLFTILKSQDKNYLRFFVSDENICSAFLIYQNPVEYAGGTRESLMQNLLQTMPQQGEVTWIGLRPSRSAPMEIVNEVNAQPGEGLEGDRFKGTTESKRQVTLIQEEHLKVVGDILGKQVDPAYLRRNIVVRGINLLALHNQLFKIGQAVLECTGYCHPCSNMERALGNGGYNAMRGHGGITARVVEGGVIKKGDSVILEKS